MMTEKTESFYGRNRHFIPAPIRRWGRIAHSLYLQRLVGFAVPSAPHFDEASTPFFTEQLKAAHAYLEFGSGGSTFLASQLGKPFATVESDRFFLESVKRKILGSGVRLDPARQKLVAVDIGLTESWGVPVFQKQTATRLKRWRRYFSAPWDESWDVEPDLVLVDGRFRVACALNASINLFDRGDWTVLFDDYEGRAHYKGIEQFLSLSQMVGRMAVFKQKSGVSKEELQRALEQYAGDWR